MAKSQGADPAQSAWNRFLFSSLAFLVFETFVIILLGSSLIADTDSSILFIGIVAIAGIGYLAYGAFVGSWLSAAVIVLPVLIALTTGSTGSGSIPGTDAVPLYVAWVFFSYFFVPAWLIGLLISFVVRQPARDEP